MNDLKVLNKKNNFDYLENILIGKVLGTKSSSDKELKKNATVPALRTTPMQMAKIMNDFIFLFEFKLFSRSFDCRLVWNEDTDCNLTPTIGKTKCIRVRNFID